ncbi:MAG: hypothetical protein ACRD3W_02180, partial [Terriglobales bacterium]
DNPAAALKRFPRATEVLREEGFPDYAEALKDSDVYGKLRAARKIGDGNETVAAILVPQQPGVPETGVLKLSHFEGGIDPEWGNQQLRPFDARMLLPAEDLALPSGVDVTASMQEYLTMKDSYPPDDVNVLMDQIHKAGYEWADPGSHPTKQIGYNSRGELKVADYSAVGKPGENQTLDDLINGAERQRYEEDEVFRPQEAAYEREQAEEQRALSEMTAGDANVEARRQNATNDPNRTPAERQILQELFYGNSVDDAAIMRTAELFKAQPDADWEALEKQAKKEVVAVRKKAIAEGLLDKNGGL